MKKLCFLLLIIIAHLTFAQPGSNDFSFNTFDNGAFGDEKAFNDGVRVTAIQIDGKIIIGGAFTSYNGTAKNRLARINVDGSLDTTFNIGTGFNDTIFSIAIQADGKIIVGGKFTSFNGTTTNRIVRLNANGSRDVSFNIGIGFSNGTVRAIAIQTDGKILVGGNFYTYNGVIHQPYFVCLNSNGSLDTNFNNGGSGFTSYYNDKIFCIAIQPNGSIIVGGDFYSYNGITIQGMARLNPNGNLDATFMFSSNGFGQSGIVRSISIQTDGKIIAAGNFTSFNGTPRGNIARLLNNGSLDGSFNPGISFDSGVNSTAIQTDGKIIAGGNFTSFSGTSRNKIARLNANGSLDTGFNPGTGFNGTVYSTSIQSDNKIIVGGNFTSFNAKTINRISRLNSNGSLDLSFNLGTGFPGYFLSNYHVRVTKIQADGKIMVGGNFNSFNRTTRNYIARLNSNGSIDSSFNPGTGFNASVNAIAIQADGKIIIGGFFTSFNGSSINRIVRLNADGSIDTSFNIGIGFDQRVQTISIQADGKIIAGGDFSSFNGTPRNNIARINTDGSLDTNFNPGLGFNNWVRTTAIQPDGKIIIGGDFTTFNGTTRNKIARLNTDGSLDINFNPGIGFNGLVLSLIIQTDGKIVVGGDFLSFNGATRNNIARLNTDASLDNNFNPGTGFDKWIYSISLQTDGKIIVGGNFSFYDGVSRNCITRLNTNGSLDSNFNPGIGFNDWVFSTSIQTDGKIIAGGFFTTFNGIHRNRIARLNGDCINTFSSLNISSCNSYLWPINNKIYTASGSYMDTIPNSAGCDSVITLNLTINHASSAIQNASACNNYTWNINNATYTASGTYIDTIPNSKGCDSIVTLYLTINTLNLTTSVAANVITANEMGATYQWIDCSNNQTINGAINQSYSATSNGNYACILTKNNCIDTTACVNVISIGITTNTLHSALIIYPNPNSGKLFIKEADMHSNIIVFNMLGDVVYTKTVTSTEELIDLYNQPKGIYFIQATLKNGIKSAKCIIE